MARFLEKFTMMQFGKSNIRRACKLGSLVSSKICALPIYIAIGSKFASIFAKAHTLKTAGIIFTQARVILILTIVCFAQIANTIV